MSKQPGRMMIRLALTGVLALLAVMALGGCGVFDSEDSFNGTVLKNAEAAPGFALTNQFGQTVGLDSFEGRVVVLTFLYTNCPDVCPIVTAQLREVGEILGADAGEARFVAVSVDPERDTAEAAREYLEKWGLSESWQFLVGERAALEAVWKDYYVAPAVSGHDPLGSGQTPTPEPRGAIDTLSAEIAQRFLVIHSTPVFLIDREGRRRVVFTPPLEPEEVAADVRRLLD